MTSDNTLGSRLARVTDIRVDIHLRNGQCLAALLAVTKHCTVHTTLTVGPTMTVALADQQQPTLSRPGSSG